MAKESGALTVAIVNDADCPLAAASDIVLPMVAGPELSVAATKSFVASLAMLLRMTAAWADDGALAAAIERLPDRLAAATDLDWSIRTRCARHGRQSHNHRPRADACDCARGGVEAEGNLQSARRGLQSSAEFQHGPMALVSELYPILMFMPNDAAAAGVNALAADLRCKGAALFHDRSRSVPARPSADADPRSSRRRRDVPDPELLCARDPARRAARHRRGPAPAICKK